MLGLELMTFWSVTQNLSYVLEYKPISYIDYLKKDYTITIIRITNDQPTPDSGHILIRGYKSQQIWSGVIVNY